jgi:hypothetical protein
MKIRDRKTGLIANIEIHNLDNGASIEMDIIGGNFVTWNNLMGLYDVNADASINLIIEYVYETHAILDNRNIILTWENNRKNNTTQKSALYRWGGRIVEVTECEAIPAIGECHKYGSAYRVSAPDFYGVVFGKFPGNEREFARKFSLDKVISIQDVLQTIVF